MYRNYYHETKVDLDPTLCTLTMARALSLITKALEVVNAKLQKATEDLIEEHAESDKRMKEEANAAWNRKINEITEARNGTRGSFLNRKYRKLCLFLHLTEFSLFTEVEKEVQKDDTIKVEWIEDYIDKLESHYHDWGRTIGYMDGSLQDDRNRLETLKTAVGLSDTVNLSVKDIRIISYYGSINENS